MTFSFRTYIAILLFIGAVAISGILSWLAYISQSSRDVALAENTTLSFAKLLTKSSLSIHLGDENIVYLEDDLRLLTELLPVSYAYVTDIGGRIIGTSNSSKLPVDIQCCYEWEPPLDKRKQNENKPLEFRLNSSFSIGPEKSFSSGDWLILMEIPINEFDHPNKIGSLFVFLPKEQILASSKQSAAKLAAWLFFSLVICAGFGAIILSKRISAPIEDITIAIKESIQESTAGKSVLEKVKLLRSSISIREITILKESIIHLYETILDQHKRIEESRTSRQLGELAAQVAHDIRSPLAALSMAQNDLADLPEDTRVMVRSAINRIRDIANNLIEKNRIPVKSTDQKITTETEEKSSQLLISLLEGIIAEKRMQYRSKMGIEIDTIFKKDTYGLFALIPPKEFKRVISNIINNSVEAMNKGTVILGVEGNLLDQIKIKISDNGSGIPPEVLAKLGQRGETYGKAEGSGLGLYHARTSIESWGGKLEVQSELGKGTTVIISLPRAETPKWFVKELQILSRSNLVILDDDDSIHRIWQGRADSANLSYFGITLVHLATPKDLRNFKLESVEKGINTKFLLDYELLGFSETGLDLIEELGIASESILVTSRFEEPSIQKRCLKLNVPLIPKGMAGFVPIKVISPKTV